uniref:hypothetical protein n=1 Tax=Peniophora lycii TaxID=154539 RepID=UPI001BEEEB4D|nr:hypothetical protein MFQ47_mgp19 [Peniophora lycii]QUA00858.1 hypothetical protein [Peniophora lycii]
MNQITLPWLKELNDILVWTITHIQPISEWQISIAWIPAIIGLTTLASYFYWYPDTDFVRDISSIFGSMWHIINMITFGGAGKVAGLFAYGLSGSFNLFKSCLQKVGSLFRGGGGTDVGVGTSPISSVASSVASAASSTTELPDPTTTGT